MCTFAQRVLKARRVAGHSGFKTIFAISLGLFGDNLGARGSSYMLRLMDTLTVYVYTYNIFY